MAATTQLWGCVAGVLVGIGVSLVLDEFALILHLEDVYWTREGRVSVDLVSLVAACLGLVLVGFSPIGVDDVSSSELTLRVTGAAFLGSHLVVVLFCLLKGKFRVALIGVFLLPVGLVGAVRIAHPDSIWARRYSPARREKAVERAALFERRYQPMLRRWRNLVGGKATGGPGVSDSAAD